MFKSFNTTLALRLTFSNMQCLFSVCSDAVSCEDESQYKTQCWQCSVEDECHLHWEPRGTVRGRTSGSEWRSENTARPAEAREELSCLRAVVRNPHQVIIGHASTVHDSLNPILASRGTSRRRVANWCDIANECVELQRAAYVLIATNAAVRHFISGAKLELWIDRIVGHKCVAHLVGSRFAPRDSCVIICRIVGTVDDDWVTRTELDWSVKSLRKHRTMEHWTSNMMS